MRYATLLAITFTLLGSSLLGCSLGASLPEGRIRCDGPSDCPSDWVCRKASATSTGVCHRNGPTDAADNDANDNDANVLTDSSVIDDSGDTDAAVLTDAMTGTDAGEHDASELDASEPDLDAATDAGVDAASDASTGPQPTVSAVVVTQRYLNPGQSTPVLCLATDPESSPLSYAWTAPSGSFTDPSDNSTSYIAESVGVGTVTCRVQSDAGGSDQEVGTVRVYPSGWLTLLPLTLDSNDRSGHGNDGTINNGTYASDRAGATGASIELSGNGDITLPNESMFDLTAWTFVATLRPTAGQGGTIIRKGDSAFGAFSILLYADNASSLPGRLQYYQATSGSPYSAVLGSYSAQANTFFQLAVTRSATGGLRAYVDGVLIHTQTGIPDAAQNDDPIVLGNGPLGAYSGIIDEIQIYNRVLDQAEVTALTTMQ